ncbi:MAG: DNA-processing protein DprA, partial [Microbacterium gubbeenense]
GDALSRRPRTLDDLARRSGLAPDDVAAVLGLLALEGRAEARADGWVGVS